MQIQIRKMQIEDYEQVSRLWRDTPGMGLRRMDDSREGIARYLARNPDTCFIAETRAPVQESAGTTDPAATVGAVLCGHDGRRGFIYHLAVHASARREGVGTALVDAALAALKAQGITRVSLVAFQSNAAGNAFWETQGFEARPDLVFRNRSLDDRNTAE